MVCVVRTDLNSLFTLWQDCTHVPFSSVEQLSQKDVKAGRLQQRVHGAIVHGLGKYFYLVDPDLVPKGGNQGLRIEMNHVGRLLTESKKLPFHSYNHFSGHPRECSIECQVRIDSVTVDSIRRCIGELEPNSARRLPPFGRRPGV